MKTTDYFEAIGKTKHPEANRTDWIEQVLTNPDQRATQRDGRIRYWGYVPEAGRYMRVVTLEDGETVHNVFFDRGYRRRRRG